MHGVEPGVAVGAVDDRCVRGRERDGLLGEVEMEVGRGARACGNDALEHAVEGSFGIDDAADALDGAEIGLCQRVRAFECRHPRLTAGPWPEGAIGHHRALRQRVLDVGAEGHRSIRRHLRHHERTDVPHLRRLVGLLGHDRHARLTCRQLRDDQRGRLARGRIARLGRGLRRGGRGGRPDRLLGRRLLVRKPLFVLAVARRDVELQALDLDEVYAPRRPQHLAQRGRDIERSDFYEWRHVASALMAQHEVSPPHAEHQPELDVEVAEFHLAVEGVLQEGHRLLPRPRVETRPHGERGDDGAHQQQDKQPRDQVPPAPATGRWCCRSSSHEQLIHHTAFAGGCHGACGVRRAA